MIIDRCADQLIDLRGGRYVFCSASHTEVKLSAGDNRRAGAEDTYQLPTEE